jgi:DNA adenine methylase
MEHIPAPYKRYPGGKSGNHTYKTIINQIPPIKALISLFSGNAGIERRINMRGGLLRLNDLNNEVYHRYLEIEKQVPGDILLSVSNYDGIEMLKKYIEQPVKNKSKTLIYCDPPYLFETRSSQRAIYGIHEWNYDGHVEFLKLIKQATEAGYLIAISHPNNMLYASILDAWRTIEYYTVVSSGKKMRDTLWMNYPQPEKLQHYSYIGSNYRERENKKRQLLRLSRKIQCLPDPDRNKLLDILNRKIV